MKSNERLTKKWFDIYLSIVTIIQGVVFTFLAENLPAILGKISDDNSIKIVFPYIVSIIIVLRFFQSQVTAALSSDVWPVSLSNILVIFSAGLIEYFLFSGFSQVENFQYNQFYLRVAITGLFGVFSFIYTLFSVVKNKRLSLDSNDHLVCEVKIQTINILLTIIMSMFSLCLYYLESIKVIYYILNSIIILILLVNIKSSIDAAFGKGDFLPFLNKYFNNN